ncbi:MAG: DUF5312 domain-containing protein [Treponema sp.]|jgi:hypothetical protein|nr:DUF5312 domain-containing protein [Treponema sp.]
MSFFDAIFSLFGGDKNPEAEMKRLLKQTVRDLAQNKYSRFYNPKLESAAPALGKFFFDAYRIVSPAQVFLQNAAKSDQLKKLVIESFLEKQHLALQARLTKDAIAERAKTVPEKDLIKQLREELSSLTGIFDNARISAVDNCYNTILGFIQFVTFDFYFLLKKFDASLEERNFSRPPKPEPVRAEYIAEDLKDFLEAAGAVDPGQDWKTALKALKTYKGGMDVVNGEHWGKLLNLVRDIRRSGILELIIRHVEKNPSWQSNPRIPGEHIVDPYIDAKKAEIEEIIGKIQHEKRTAQLDQLAKLVFGSADVIRLKYYTEKNGEIYVKKSLGGFILAAGLNYLKAFLLDYVKKDIRELCDLFLIRGQWTNNLLSQQLSNGYHEIMAIADEILAFDEALADNGENGSRLKAAIVKADRDKGQAKYIGIILKSVNGEAQKMINRAANSLIVIGRNLKSILDDYPKNPHDLIINWKELESASESSLPQRITAVYKKLYAFVQIMQFFARPPEEEEA